MRLHTSTFDTTARARFGSSYVPVLIIVAALGISAAIFFLFTRKKMLAEAAPAATTQSTTPAGTTPALGQDSAIKTVLATPSSAPVAIVFASPLDLGKQMARSLAESDFKSAGKLSAAADPIQAERAAMLFQKIQELGFKLGTEDQVEILGLVENRTRITIPLTKPGLEGIPRLQLDLERDERMGWKIAQIVLPKEASAALAALPASAAPVATQAISSASGTAPMQPLFSVSEGPDALTFAGDFVRLLLQHDFTAARRLVDDKKVPVERLVGLCIVFEEGQYALKPSKPLLVTVANPEVSWVIAQVESETLKTTTEFGLEIKRVGTSNPWKVVGLNLSDILGSFAESASKLGIPYTPIVKNPKGGESLALYFEYDRAELHPRAMKQIEVIASMLKADPGKKLRIAGHTDALGDDTYNIRLSQGRAESVKRQLVLLGVPKTQVETTGLGKAQPLSPNQKSDGTDDPAARSRNRRAEIYLDF